MSSSEGIQEEQTVLLRRREAYYSQLQAGITALLDTYGTLLRCCEVGDPIQSSVSNLQLDIASARTVKETEDLLTLLETLKKSVILHDVTTSVDRRDALVESLRTRQTACSTLLTEYRHDLKGMIDRLEAIQCSKEGQ